MKIKLVKAYKGPLGTFKAGTEYDLYPNIIGLLPLDCLPDVDWEGVCHQLTDRAKHLMAAADEASTKLQPLAAACREKRHQAELAYAEMDAALNVLPRIAYEKEYERKGKDQGRKSDQSQPKGQAVSSGKEAK